MAIELCAEVEMEALFMETEHGMVPIDPGIIRKYNLEKGFRAPFSRSRIVGENGDYPVKPWENSAEKHWLDDPADQDRSDAEGGVLFTTAECIDLAQGVDSDTGNE